MIGRIPPILRRLLGPDVSVPIVLMIFAALLTVLNPAFIEGHLETLLVDVRFLVRNMFSAPHPPEDSIIVSVDEKSLSEYGRWYWSRKLQASLIEKILSGGPRALAIDIFYAEPESPEADRALAEVLAAHRDKVVVGLCIEVEQGKRFEGEIPDPLYDSVILKLENVKLLWPIQGFRVLFPPAPIGSSANFGHVYSIPDRDGKLRWEPLYLQCGEELFPSLSLQAARIALGLPLDDVRLVGGVGVEIGDRRVPTDEFGRLHINYFGREGTLRYVSAGDVLSGRVSPTVFSGKIVWLGTSAIGTFDSKITPFSANSPGVEAAATTTENVLLGNAIRPCSLRMNMLVVLVSGLFVVVVCLRLRALGTVLLILGVALALISGAVAAFSLRDVRVNLAIPLGMIVAQGGFIVSYRFRTEEKNRRFLKRTFSSYLAPELIEEMYRNRTLPELGGESRTLTAFFTDIESFSSFSEILTPVQLVELINEYLTAMTDILLSERGTLDKYEGDAIVAFFGAPMAFDDHAMRAVRTALRMQRRLGELRRDWREQVVRPGGAHRNLKGLPPEKWRPGARWPNLVHGMRMRIGINTGEIVVGNMGSTLRMNYTMTGDAVNLAARLESAAKQYGVYTLVSEATMAARFRNSAGDEVTVSSMVESRLIDRVIVVGRSEPVDVYQVVAMKGEIEETQQELLHLFGEGLEHYRNMDWDRAMAAFRMALALEDAAPGRTSPSEVYVRRCMDLRENPPVGPGQPWDGVFRMSKK